MLVLRSARLRSDLSVTYGEIEARLHSLDRTFAIARGVASPSILISLASLAFGVLRRTRPFMWATRGFLMVSIVRRILGAVRTRRAASPPARR